MANKETGCILYSPIQGLKDLILQCVWNGKQYNSEQWLYNSLYTCAVVWAYASMHKVYTNQNTLTENYNELVLLSRVVVRRPHTNAILFSIINIMASSIPLSPGSRVEC